MLNKMAISEFASDNFGKNERERGPRCPPIFFGHLKRALKLFISVPMSPLAKISGPLGRYDYPWEKEKKNKHASVTCLLAKNTKFHIFVDRSLELEQWGSLIR